jgi:hypothetical protein
VVFKRKKKTDESGSSIVKEKKEKTDYKFVLEAALESALRRLFKKSILANATIKAAKVEVPHYNKDGSLSKSKRVMYKCSDCQGLFPDRKIPVINKQGKTVQKKAFAVDHTSPVVDPTTGKIKLENGKTDWNVFIERMMVGVEFYDPKVNTFENTLLGKLSVLCHTCHDKKTLEENTIRNEVKKIKKKKKQDEGVGNVNRRKSK